tara:strand:- start:917 stop:1228 length:312 start_codon:yes stop_codon:yes gene_type:complete
MHPLSIEAEGTEVLIAKPNANYYPQGQSDITFSNSRLKIPQGPDTATNSKVELEMDGDGALSRNNPSSIRQTIDTSSILLKNEERNSKDMTLNGDSPSYLPIK